MTPAELLAAVRAAGAEPYIGPAGTAKVRGKDRLSAELLEAARARLPELLAVLQDEAEALRADLAGWLERWEVGCRWFAEDPGRSTDERAFIRFCAVAAGWGDAMASLESLSPGDPALDEARSRLDAVALEAEPGAGLLDDRQPLDWKHGGLEDAAQTYRAG